MSTSWSQQVRIPNISHSYLPQSSPLFNPASIKAITNNGNILLSHKQGVGIFSVFSQNYLNANFCFGSDSIKNHALGLRVLNDQAGKYIGLNRIALLYSYSLALSEESNLTLGVAPTIISYRQKAQNFGGSTTSGNLDLGIWFSSNNVTLGLAVNQIIQNKLIVIEEENLIKSQYVLNAKYNHRIHSLINLDYQFLYKVNTGLLNEEVIGVTANYLNNYRASVNYENTGSIYFLLGLKKISNPMFSGNFNIDFIYGLPVQKKTGPKKTIVEIILNYEF